MATDEINPFAHGSAWVRADFHLHTRADKEFSYDGEENSFVAAYVDSLKNAGIGLAVLTNHNKFDTNEFKAMRKRARKEGIGLLPGVELSVNDGSNGVHTLIVFSDQWLADGHDLINQFLNTAFAGRPETQYAQEHARANQNLVKRHRARDASNKALFGMCSDLAANSRLFCERSA